MPPPLATHEMTRRAQIVNLFLREFKSFCCPFRCHLMSVHLPRRCHFADSSQIAHSKPTPLLGKLHNIVKLPIIQLQDADKQIISAVTDRAPDIMYFIVSEITSPPHCRQLPD